MSKKIFTVLFTILVVLGTTSGIETVYASPTFDDVPYDHWAYEWVERLYLAGVTSGCSQSPPRYCPDDYVTREQMAKFLLVVIHGKGYSPPEFFGSTGFYDVPADSFFSTWIKRLSDEGLTQGCGGGRFCPNRNLTRGELAVFLLKARHIDENNYAPPALEEGEETGFRDVQWNHWAAAWIKELSKLGVTSGYSDGTFRPESFVSRAELAKFLVLSFDLPEIPSVPMATVYLQNNTGGELCYQVYGTGIDSQCVGAGEHLYGAFPSGNYEYYATSRCGDVNNFADYDGEMVHIFRCNVLN